GIVHFLQLKNAADRALSALQYENEINLVKMQALKAQIKPHFIFNSLSAIQAMYTSDPAAGEAALSKFAHHLRLNVDSDGKELIPFEEELENTLNYFELENLRWQNKLTLLLNVEYTDFSVPVLSLQPILENAIKYAGTQAKPDGCIQIAARAEECAVIVEVSDNGAGFDVGAVRENAVGLKNVGERFRYILNADVHVDSKIGVGTTVTISIPGPRDGTDGANNRLSSPPPKKQRSKVNK
ncbi:MAG: histidine kinase, partial [Clostridiales bacterium]|nr:histidine kinase [Clostridiales bacterium]